MLSLYKISSLTLLILISINYSYGARLDIVFGTKNDPHLGINHCYHWIDQKNDNYLDFKYEHALKNKEELTFYTTSSTSNGSVAGPGLYCAKSPSGSYSYGDRLIRVDLVDDVVMLDDTTGVKYCGHNGLDSTNSDECASKDWDIKFYNGGGIGNSAWYVIQNPMAVDSWSANSDQIISDLNASIAINDSSFGDHARATISAIKAERKKLGEKVYYNQNARLSIFDVILNSPDKLKQMPPLNVVTRVARDKSNRIDSATRLGVINTYLDRALQSDEISYKDFEDLFKLSSELKTKFENTVKKSLAYLKNYNASVILEAIIKHDSALSSLISSNHYQLLVQKLFENEYHLNKLSKSDVFFNSDIKRHIAIKLAGLEKKAFDISLITSIFPLITKVYSTRYRESKRMYWKNKIFQTNKSKISIIIDNESFNFPSSDEHIKLYCQSAFGVKSNPESISLGVKSTRLKLFEKGSDFNPSEVCSLISQNWQSIIGIDSVENDSKLFILRGKMEAHKFTLLGATRDQINNSCRLFYKSIPSIGDIDDIDFTINGSNKKVLRNEKSYWKDVDSTCREVNNSIVGLIPSKYELKIKRDFEKKKIEFAKINKDKTLFSISGLVENTPYLLYGINYEEIYDQCIQLHKTIEDPTIVDDITYSFNGNKEQSLRNSSDYWKTDAEVCSQILNTTKGKLPYRISLKLRDKYSLASIRYSNLNKQIYSVEGDMEGVPFIFFGANLDEISNQCSDSYSEIINITSANIDEIFYMDSSGEKKRLYNSSSYWDTKSSLCDQIGSIASILKIPSLQELAEIARYESELNKFNTLNIKGEYSLAVVRYEMNKKFLYYGKTRDEFEKMCFEKYKSIENKKIDDIYISFNGAYEEHLYNSSSYWDSKDSLCNKISSYLVGKVESESEIQFKKNRPGHIKSNQLLKSKSKATYQISAILNGQEIFFHGESQVEVLTHCKSVYENIIGQNISTSSDFILFNKNYSISNRYGWDNKESYCSDLISEVSSKILTIDQIKRKQDIESTKALYNSYIPDAKRVFDNSDKEYKVTLQIGGYDLYIAINSYDEFLNKCSTLKTFEILIDRESNLTYRINNQSEYNLRSKNSYPWYDVANICTELSSELRHKILTTKELNQQRKYNLSIEDHKVSGRIGYNNFFFTGNYLEKIINDCESFIRGEDLGSGHLAYELKHNSETLVNSSLEGGRLCESIKNRLAKDVISKLEYSRREFIKDYRSSSNAFNIFVSINSSNNPGFNKIYLSLKSRDEFFDMCVDYFPTLRLPEKRRLRGTFTVNNDNETSFKLKKAYHSPQVFCKKLEDEIKPYVPSENTVKSEKAYTSSDAHVKVTGKLGVINFYFYGDDEDAIRDQCLSQYDLMAKENEGHRIKYLYYSSNKNNNGRIRAKNKSFACDKLMESI